MARSCLRGLFEVLVIIGQKVREVSVNILGLCTHQFERQVSVYLEPLKIHGRISKLLHSRFPLYHGRVGVAL